MTIGCAEDVAALCKEELGQAAWLEREEAWLESRVTVMAAGQGRGSSAGSESGSGSGLGICEAWAIGWAARFEGDETEAGAVIVQLDRAQ